MSTRTRVLLALLAMFASTLIAALSRPEVHGWWGIVGKVQWALVFGGGWLLVVGLKCHACGAKLSRDFPVGTLLALPFSVQPCRRCGQRL